MQPTWKDPMQTPEGELLTIVKQIEASIVAKNKYCSMCKNVSCMGCKEDKMEDAKPDSIFHGTPKEEKKDKDLEKGNYSDDDDPKEGYKSDRGDKKMPKLPKSKKQKHNKPNQTPLEKLLQKWEQEPSVENSVPTFLDHSGGTPVEAINYHTNQTYPDYQDKAPKSTFISEKAQIPSVAKTGYDEKGSSLHMHLNDKGVGSYNYRAPIEESMMQLKKAGGYGNPGLVEQIAAELEQLMGRL